MRAKPATTLSSRRRRSRAPRWPSRRRSTSSQYALHIAHALFVSRSRTVPAFRVPRYTSSARMSAPAATSASDFQIASTHGSAPYFRSDADRAFVSHRARSPTAPAPMCLHGSENDVVVLDDARTASTSRNGSYRQQRVAQAGPRPATRNAHEMLAARSSGSSLPLASFPKILMSISRRARAIVDRVLRRAKARRRRSDRRNAPCPLQHATTASSSPSMSARDTTARRVPAAPRAFRSLLVILASASTSARTAGCRR